MGRKVDLARSLLVCGMAFYLSVAFLVVCQKAVHAEWVAIEKLHQVPGLQTVYVDPASVGREGDPVTMWQSTDFRWMQRNPKGTPRFLSTKSRKQFECADQRVRLLEATDYSGHMATGGAADGYVDETTWWSVEPVASIKLCGMLPAATSDGVEPILSPSFCPVLHNRFQSLYECSSRFRDDDGMMEGAESPFEGRWGSRGGCFFFMSVVGKRRDCPLICIALVQ